MPAVLARLAPYLRSAVLFLMQTGVFLFLTDIVFPKLNAGIAEIAASFGVDEDTAQDIAANEFLAMAEAGGVTIATMRSRLPLKIADRLGFTTKGYAKRKLAPAVEAKVAAAKKGIIASTAEMVVPSLAESEIAVAGARNASSGFRIAADYLLKTLSVTFIGFIAVNNLIDFGNWNSGAYQKTFQKIFAAVTFGLLVPDADYRQTKTVSPDVFSKVYNTYKDSGAISIRDPWKNQTVTFTRDNLIDLLDQVGAKLLLTTKKAATKDVLLASQLFITFSDAAATPTPVAATSTGTSSVQVAAQPPAQIKIFTGVISGGTLGAPTDFTPRTGDMIQSEAELQAAAKNNLAAFVASLPGRFYYELGIVNTVKTRGGFTQKGAAVRVISSYTTTGKPRYKTIYNKFAQLRLFVSDENAHNVKLATINLGPVNSVDFQPTGEELQGLADALTPDLFTSDVTEIAQVGQAPAGTPVAYTPAPDAPQAAPPAIITPPLDPTQPAGRDNPIPVTIYTPTAGLFRDVGGFGMQIFRALDTGYTMIFDLTGDNSPLFASPTERASFGNAGGQGGEAIRRLKDRYGFDYWSLPIVNMGDYFQAIARRGLGYNDANGAFHAPIQMSTNLQDFINAKPATLTPMQINNTPTARVVASPAAAAAATLFDYYTAAGQALPSLPDRAETYASAGLGAANTYVGTAEQNGRLLAWLKTHAGS